ncbi:hypothetical protein [Paenibacillus sp. FJAT-26967]|uniref:hypothetical protein n=1 Tax=Paenibacillus sp. FJAT-26967 TaxID=1729690 RepID=UPI000AC3AD3F|nr:hypothetical protein [Paenibacillus sp. FJAT-26967]
MYDSQRNRSGSLNGRYLMMQDGQAGGGGSGYRSEHQGRRGKEHKCSGAQTYRRGRVLLFLEKLQAKRGTLARQLEQAEFEAIRPVLCGELKAIDQVIEEYVLLFDLQEDADSSTTLPRNEREE